MARDLLPRRFQADGDRFYRRVVVPALHELRSDHDGKGRTFDSWEAFLDGAEKLTTRMLAFEARRCFALSLHGLFERQLRVWARAGAEKGEWLMLAKIEFEKLLCDTAASRDIDLVARDLGRVLVELHLLANVVRHGDGVSVNRLKAIAPHFWGELEDADAQEFEDRFLLSENVWPSDQIIRGYARATVRFWGLADREFGSVVDAPY